MAGKRDDDTRRKGGRNDDEDPDEDDYGNDPDEDEPDDDEDIEKAAVTDAQELDAFIQKSVRAAIRKELSVALIKALADPDTATALAKAVAPELGIGSLRKSVRDLKDHISDRFDTIDETTSTLSKAIADIPASTVPAKPDDDTAKTTPATKPLSKSVDGEGDAEPLDKPGEKPDVNAQRGALLAKAKGAARRGAKIDQQLLSKASIEMQGGGMQDSTWTDLSKACDAAGIR